MRIVQTNGKFESTTGLDLDRFDKIDEPSEQNDLYSLKNVARFILKIL